jgi:transcriptional regulator with XRE-family HTH domain
MTDSNRQPWEKPGYSDVIAAAQTESGVEVRFANGDTVTVPPGLLGVPQANFSVQVDGEDTTRVRVITGTNVRDVDWTVIRAATDERFASEMRARDTEESHRVGRRIRALRENRGLAQRDLAKLVGMPAPQLSKLEKGESDMRLSTVRSLLRAMDATFADISGPEAQELSVAALSRVAKKAGTPSVVLKWIAEQVSASQFAAALSRGFGWDAGELDGGQLSAPGVAAPALFKSGSAKPEDSPLLALAYSLSEISVSGWEGPVGTVPQDPAELRRQLLDVHTELTLDALLAWVWAAGIPVIPMSGPGGFSAAVWTVEDRPVIVLKESRDLLAFWIFDLAHELGHLAAGHVADGGLAETVKRAADPSDPREQQANAYALDLLVPGHEQLIARVRERSQANGPLLFKGAVEAVARAANLSPVLVGVVASYELTDIARYQDRWGSTTNLGKHEGSGRQTAGRHFAANVSLSDLTDLDMALIRALVLRS